jgi:hypothetical protein
MAIDQRRAIVRAESLIATEPFQSDEEKCYHLSGTNILPQEKGAILAATDGNTLLAIREPDGYASGLPMVWNCDAQKRLKPLLSEHRKLFKRNPIEELWVDLQFSLSATPTLTVRAAKNAAEILDGGGTVEATVTGTDLVIAGDYVEFARVFRHLPSGATEAPVWTGGAFAVQARFLQRFADLAKLLDARVGKDRQHCVQFGSPGHNGAIAVTIPGRPDVVGLLMPYGWKALPLVPDWITALISEPEEATAKQAA